LFLYVYVGQFERGQSFAVMARGRPVLVNSWSTRPRKILCRHSGVYRKYVLDYACMNTYAYHCVLSFPPVESLCYNIIYSTRKKAQNMLLLMSIRCTAGYRRLWYLIRWWFKLQSLFFPYWKFLLYHLSGTKHPSWACRGFPQNIRKLWCYFQFCQDRFKLHTCQFTYLFTYLLNPWSRVLLEKLTGSAASQEIPRILWNPKVPHRTHKCPPPVPILS